MLSRYAEDPYMSDMASGSDTARPGSSWGNYYPSGAPAEPQVEQGPSWFDQLMGQPEESGGGGGGGGGPQMDPSSFFQVRGAPGFKAPRFQAPTAESLQSDPGFQFRLGAGRDAMERGAAARGVLRTGGTLRDLLEYGQKFGSQEYEGAYNRALQAHEREFQGAKSEYDPLFAQWQAQTGADLTKGQLEYGRHFGGRGGGGGGEDIPPPPGLYTGDEGGY